MILTYRLQARIVSNGGRIGAWRDTYVSCSDCLVPARYADLDEVKAEKIRYERDMIINLYGDESLEFQIIAVYEGVVKCES